MASIASISQKGGSRLTNYGEATIREICWNNWRGYIDGAKVIEFVDTPQETAKHAANRWWAALHAEPWEIQSALGKVNASVQVSLKGTTGQPSSVELAAPVASRDPLVE
jgi:hypothetical protein